MHGEPRAASAPQEHGTHPGGGHGGHADHTGHGHADHAAAFRDRFVVALVLAVPVVGFSAMTGMLLGYTPPTWSAWAPPVLGTVILFWPGWPFLSGAVAEIRARRPGMMLLIGMAVGVAWVASLLSSLGVGGLDFWWELALLVVIMLLGHWLEMRALGQASGALDALAALLPDTAERIGADGTIGAVAPADLTVGDVVLVRSGARVPADGTVVDGAAEVDESMITGESRPVARGTGDRVVAGTVATDSALRVRVDAVGEDTALSGIRRLVANAQASRSRAQALADRAAALLFWFAAGAGVATFAAWTLLGDTAQAVTRTVTVLVIACPHALGLAIPLVIAISTARAARSGVLVTDRLALERTRTVDTVLFDKTGTLTTGSPRVVGTAGAEQTLALAAAVEVDSEHPLARAVVTAAGGRDVPVAEGFRSYTGRGVSATVDGRPVAVGGPALLRERGLGVPAELAGDVRRWGDDGATVLYVVTGAEPGEVVGALALADAVRPESRAAVDALHARGVRVVMLTGDARPVAEAVARDLGVDEVVAEVLPEGKDEAVARLQARGAVVAMVGDGVNDAPALARADVGIAIGAGTDVAVASAGVVLASSDPRGVLSVIALSRAGYRKMLQNLWWAAGYNLVSVPLAAGVLAPVGFVLPPAVGALLMSLSTVVVALNAQLLRRVELRPDRLVS
ncbi:copper-translocating P-type ATPase [Pseudonocardia sp. Ae505_Ps2]|uniref:copper-translocating P-type ATPase n=1 Tax=Pseudonocardia sp. Ae505_Ps2 TaxID=1885034 RepID=UPI00094DFF1C|nr:copper-translocating P-type ATPase [Pseudonocardia sp. Ae505_Ps2]OLM12599.1 Lead, cadmium, zinc and mercury transporting ATPase, Copper-translocating P-type ATPase [Pseudonocardia sp. Ae505_Ps2]